MSYCWYSKLQKLNVACYTRHKKAVDVSRLCYERMNHTELLKAAGSINWYPESPEPTVHDRWKHIKRELTTLTERFAPLEPRRNKNKPLWWKPSIDRAIKVRSRSWNRFKLYGTHQAWCAYKKERNITQDLQRTAKYNFESKLAIDVKHNPKKFYAYVQSNARTRESVGVLDKPDGGKAQTERDKASTLVDFFKSVNISITVKG